MNRIVIEITNQQLKHRIPIDIINIIVELVTFEDTAMNLHYRSAAINAAETVDLRYGVIYQKCPMCRDEYSDCMHGKCFYCKLYVCWDCIATQCTECYKMYVCVFCHDKLGKCYPLALYDENGDEDEDEYYGTCMNCKNMRLDALIQNI